MKTNNSKPPIGREILFFYDDIFHIGYLLNDNGSNNHRKWVWYSYLKGYDEISDLVKNWFELPNLCEHDLQ